MLILLGSGKTLNVLLEGKLSLAVYIAKVDFVRLPSLVAKEKLNMRRVN